MLLIVLAVGRAVTLKPAADCRCQGIGDGIRARWSEQTTVAPQTFPAFSTPLKPVLVFGKKMFQKILIFLEVCLKVE